MAVPEPRPRDPERPRLAPAGPAEPAAVPARRRSRLRYLLGILGPGLVTGAADDDPSGIATYSQTGAQFGYGQLWTSVWMLPLMTAVQEACGRIGNVTGKGLARNIKDHYSLRTLRVLVILLAAANLINVGADIGALGASAALIIHIPVAVLMVIFTAVILTLEIVVSYRRYARVLKWLTVSLLAYPITAFLVPEPWGTIFRATFVPHIEFSAAFFYVITAVIGLCLNFIGVNPIQALVFAAVFNGVIAVPLIWFINRIAANADTMGNARSGWLSRTVMMITFLGMAAAVVAMALSYLHP
jgi:Mn2+/Fe2+ NRAMP family transporter